MRFRKWNFPFLPPFYVIDEVLDGEEKPNYNLDRLDILSLLDEVYV
jgi:hypothetical protein